MKHVGRITRAAHLFGLALVLAGCADQKPTSPDVGSELGPVVVGSIIKSSVVTATTMCRPNGECGTTTRYSEISEKVGRTSTLRAAMGLSVGEGKSGAQNQATGPKRFHVSGRTLYGDAILADGSASHIELTGDAVAKGKLSGVRLLRAGKPLLAFNAKWKDVGGVAYREHSDVTVFREGRLALHQEKSFAPIAVLPGDASDRSAATLTLNNDYGLVGDPSATDCPYSPDVCLWLQSYNPAGAVNSLWTTMANVGYDISNWWNSIWSHADPDTSSQLAEVMLLAMEGYNEPGITAISITLLAIVDGGLTNELAISLAADIDDWLMGLFLI